ncbi:MAG: MarR family transcriptional regulator [Gorillibacterium sp.]|nr:MarR family transcriptional regulator [Gorillibacterium sp.]
MVENTKDSLYYLLSQVIRLHYHQVHGHLEKIGIYPGQPPVLFQLAEKNGLSQKEMAENMKIKPATLTVMLNRMESGQLVERRQDPDDQRVSRVYITDLGRDRASELKEIFKTLEEECFQNVTPDEQAFLRRMFMQMRDNLTEANKKLGDVTLC